MRGRAKITFRFDVATGRQVLLVDYESARDALPREHEDEHRALMAELRRRGVLDGEGVVVERLYAGVAEGAGAEGGAGGGAEESAAVKKPA